MQNWKVALIGGSAGVGTVLFLKQKWTDGIILPDFIERGNSFLEVASRVGDRLAEAAENGSQSWYEALLSR
jgi:hypothetical protein